MCVIFATPLYMMKCCEYCPVACCASLSNKCQTYYCWGIMVFFILAGTECRTFYVDVDLYLHFYYSSFQTQIFLVALLPLLFSVCGTTNFYVVKLYSKICSFQLACLSCNSEETLNILCHTFWWKGKPHSGTNQELQKHMIFCVQLST